MQFQTSIPDYLKLRVTILSFGQLSFVLKGHLQVISNKHLQAINIPQDTQNPSYTKT